MALPVRDQLKYWGIAAAVFFVILWFLGDVLLPFVLGGAIAYFLDPVADRLEELGLSRAMATAVITVSAFVMFLIIALPVSVTLIEQAGQLFNEVPVLAREFAEFLTKRFPSILEEGSSLNEALNSVGATIQSKGGELLNALFASAAGLVNFAVLFLIVPVVAVYMLLDWDRMVARIDELLPRDHAPIIRHLAREVDQTLAAFIRGMGTVCLVLGTYYAFALWLVGLQFGLVVGFIAGLVTFIPYLGALIGGALAMGLALFQYWGGVYVIDGQNVEIATDWLRIALVGGIFMLGQVIEGNVLTPKLVGNSVGLHPVWLLLALSVFGSLFGFIGMLVAVPVAASLGVIARFLTGLYQGSLLFRGLEGHGDG
jgi:predicted PurR-regulated permease PerM